MRKVLETDMDHASDELAESRIGRHASIASGRTLSAYRNLDFEQARRLERQRFLAEAREMFGEPLAEAILTHDPDHLIGLETTADGMTDEEIKPLRDAVSIAKDMSVRADAAMIQAWFVGMNDFLDDQEPALVIRDDPRAVRDAARAFLAHG